MKTRGNRLYKYSYEVIKGILYRVYEHTVREIEKGIKQIVVPTPFREYVIRTAHGSLVGGHLATKKTMDRITSSFNWPGISGDVSRFCRSCDIRQIMTPRRTEFRAPLGTMPLISESFQQICIDIIGLINPISNKKNKYNLPVVDFANRYPE